jgi:hypothetical protein
MMLLGPIAAPYRVVMVAQHPSFVQGVAKRTLSLSLCAQGDYVKLNDWFRFHQ